MNWDQKTKMIQLGNKSQDSQEDKDKFYNYIVGTIDNFDSQAWDMFITLINLVEIKSNPDFVNLILKKFDDPKVDRSKLSIRASMRIEILRTLLEETTTKSK